MLKTGSFQSMIEFGLFLVTWAVDESNIVPPRHFDIQYDIHDNEEEGYETCVVDVVESVVVEMGSIEIYEHFEMFKSMYDHATVDVKEVDVFCIECNAPMLTTQWHKCGRCGVRGHGLCLDYCEDHDKYCQKCRQ
eukprot:NODE_12_length_54577_cov_0.384100.p28 type:complete len:135 gc:universal NODE_12_length_54577_cov_0.384100:43195-43599(+)